MDKFSLLTRFIHRMVSDHRLTPIHLSLSMALCDTWVENRFPKSCQVSRKALMRTAHIKSKATYHKAIRELQSFGYLKYMPSYHPMKGSEMTILVDDGNAMTDEAK